MKKLLSLLCSALLLTSCGTMKDVTELQTEDTVVGTGEMAKAGDTVEVSYTGKLTDGTVFDSSKNHSGTFSFTVGAGEVIEGWDKGIPGMKVGGTRILTIPADMGYGDYGVPGMIPGGATLIFEVELISIEE